jgi:hypothetical protein
LSFADRLLFLIKDNRVRGLLLAALIFPLASFYRAWCGHSIMVDDHGLSGLPVVIVFTAFCMAMTLYSVSLYRLWRAGSLDIDAIRALAFALAAVFSFMIPMMSNDIFSLLTYGDAANRGVDVYTDVQSLHLSPYFGYVSTLWKHAPCVYGPISLGSARLACMVANGNLPVAIAAYKVIVFLWACVFIEMSYRIAAWLTVSAGPLLFIVLNPIFLLQGVGQQHCDMLAVALAACMLYFYLRRNWYLAFLFAGIAIAAKMNFVLVIPFLIVALFLDKESWGAFLYKAAAGLWIAAMVLFVLYFPYYTSPDTFARPLNFLFGQNPAKSIAEVMGDIVYFAPQVVTGHTEGVNSSIHAPGGLPESQLAVWLAVKITFQVFAALLCLVIFIRFWMGKRDSRKWMQVFLRFLLAFLLFYSHVFYAWYLMILLPFVWYEDDKRFMQWLFVLTCFSNVHDIMCSVNHGTPVYFLVLPLTFFSVLVFFWRFRNNFFSSWQEPNHPAPL